MLILFPYSDILLKINIPLLIVLSVLTCETHVFHTCEYLSTRKVTSLSLAACVHYQLSVSRRIPLEEEKT